MGSKNSNLAISYTLVLLLVGFASSDFNQDKAECENQLVGLGTCVPYVGGDAKVPPLDCCTGLKQVIEKSKKCLCLVIKYRDEPNLGFKMNATLVLALPTACHTPANLSECVTLLHLAPNSTEAQIFEGHVNSTEGSITTTVGSVKGNSPSNASSRTADEKNGGGLGKRRLGWSEDGLWGFAMAFHILPTFSYFVVFYGPP